MVKTVNQTHIIGERGAIRFNAYCNQHEPYLIFRPVTVNDFGIDGEVELTEINSDNKTTPTAQIIKIQIKSTAKDNSYIKKETDSSFEFYAKSEDVDYWEKYGQYGIKVLLVIFDDRIDKLYCKEITNFDVLGAKPRKGNQAAPVQFSKTENLLELGKHNFTEMYSKCFTGRIKHNVKETLISNLFPFKSLPKSLYVYKSKFTDKRTIWNLIEENQSPYYILVGENVFTFNEISSSFNDFKEKILLNPTEPRIITWNEIMENILFKNHYIELVNNYIKGFMGSRGLKFSREYKRYYFKLKEEDSERKAKYLTRVTRKEGRITVVSEYTYGKDTFFRHHAVEMKILFIENQLYLSLVHQWFFTLDRKKPLDSEVITKYSNGINKKFHNKEILDLQHFWWSFLAWNYETNSDHELIIFDGRNLKQTSIIVGKYLKEIVDFGIPTDGEKFTGKRKNTDVENKSNQTKMF